MKNKMNLYNEEYKNIYLQYLEDNFNEKKYKEYKIAFNLFSKHEYKYNTDVCMFSYEQYKKAFSEITNSASRFTNLKIYIKNYIKWTEEHLDIFNKFFYEKEEWRISAYDLGEVGEVFYAELDNTMKYEYFASFEELMSTIDKILMFEEKNFKDITKVLYGLYWYGIPECEMPYVNKASLVFINNGLNLAPENNKYYIKTKYAQYEVDAAFWRTCLRLTSLKSYNINTYPNKSSTHYAKKTYEKFLSDNNYVLKNSYLSKEVALQHSEPINIENYAEDKRKALCKIKKALNIDSQKNFGKKAVKESGLFYRLLMIEKEKADDEYLDSLTASDFSILTYKKFQLYSKWTNIQCVSIVKKYYAWKNAFYPNGISDIKEDNPNNTK